MCEDSYLVPTFKGGRVYSKFQMRAAQVDNRIQAAHTVADDMMPKTTGCTIVNQKFSIIYCKNWVSPYKKIL